MRIVSLLPSATDIVCALGRREELVGISHECELPTAQILWPPGGEPIGLPEPPPPPVVTRSRIDGQLSSAAIDAAVRSSVKHALSIYDVDFALLESLRPDVILTQDLCKVCAVSLGDIQRACDGIPIVSVAPTNLAGIFADARRIAAAIEGPRSGIGGQDTLEKYRKRGQRLAPRPRVATIEWLDPIMLGGLWMPELVDIVGGLPVGAVAGEHAPTVTLDELVALAPDIVVITPCGFTLARTLVERDLLDRITAALPGAQVYAADGNRFFNRPGPTIVEAAEILGACVFPQQFASAGAGRWYVDLRR